MSAQVLTLANRKGGVGKSMIAMQLAYRANQEHGLRVLVIDLDDQCNCSDALTTGKLATISPIHSSELFIDTLSTKHPAPLTVITADASRLRFMNTQGDKHNSYATNFKRNIQAQREQFDLIVIDVPPAADVRQLSALIASTHVAIPIMLSKESISGIAQMLNDPMIGLNNIKAKLNPSLSLLGVVVNLVDSNSPFQHQAFTLLVKNYRQLLIETPKDAAELARDDAKGPNAKVWPAFCRINRSTAILEAQAAGLPVSELGKRASTASSKLARVCDQLLTNMEAIEGAANE